MEFLVQIGPNCLRVFVLVCLIVTLIGRVKNRLVAAGCRQKARSSGETPVACFFFLFRTKHIFLAAREIPRICRYGLAR